MVVIARKAVSCSFDSLAKSNLSQTEKMSMQG